MGLKYPKGEIVWVCHYDTDGNMRYLTTSKPAREYYYLYELRDGALVKLGRDRSPKALEEKFINLS